MPKPEPGCEPIKANGNSVRCKATTSRPGCEGRQAADALGCHSVAALASAVAVVPLILVGWTRHVWVRVLSAIPQADPSQVLAHALAALHPHGTHGGGQAPRWMFWSMDGRLTASPARVTGTPEVPRRSGGTRMVSPWTAVRPHRPSADGRCDRRPATGRSGRTGERTANRMHAIAYTRTGDPTALRLAFDEPEGRGVTGPCVGDRVHTVGRPLSRSSGAPCRRASITPAVRRRPMRPDRGPW